MPKQTPSPDLSPAGRGEETEMGIFDVWTGKACLVQTPSPDLSPASRGEETGIGIFDD
jgi:hypothetical protein